VQSAAASRGPSSCQISIAILQAGAQLRE